jgi:hypothetical protein
MFNLALDDRSYEDDHDFYTRYSPSYFNQEDNGLTGRPEDSDARLMEMLAAQAAHREVETVGVGEDDIATDENMSEAEKRDLLQRNLNLAASNGDVERVRRLVSGKAREYVNVNMPDEEGTVPLIYASCFVGGGLLVLVQVWRIPKRSFGLVYLREALKRLLEREKADLTGRDIKTWFLHSSKQEPTSINKTVIGGVHLCGP